MHIFIKKTALFVVLFLFPLVLFEVYVRNQWIDPYDAKRAFLENEKNTCEVLVLGTSHAWAGVNPEWVSDNCLNVANAFQPFYYDYRILEKYVPQMESLKAIVLPMSYTSFFNKPSTYHQNLYSIYWGLSPYGEKMISDHSLVLSLGLKRLLERLINDENNFVNKGWLALEGEYDGSPKLAKNRLAHMHENMDMKNWDEAVSWLDKILALGEKHGLRMILFCPPYSSELNRQMESYPYNHRINDYLISLSKNKNVELLYFNNNEIYGNDLFKDADHLNTAGAFVLSNAIHEVLSNPITTN